MKNWPITDNDWGSHQPLLFKVLEKYGKSPMLELGCGDFSTPYMSQMGDLDIYSTDPIWGAKYEHIANIKYIQDWKKFTISKEYSVILLDSEELVVDRIKQIPQLLAVADIVVMHDWRNGLRKQNCKYQGIYKGKVPWTWWGSNTIDTTTEEILK